MWMLGTWGVEVEEGDGKRLIWPKAGVHNICVRVSHLGSTCNQWGGSDTYRAWFISFYCRYGWGQINGLLLAALHWLWKEPCVTSYLCRYLTCLYIKAGHMKALPWFWKPLRKCITPNKQSSDVVFWSVTSLPYLCTTMWPSKQIISITFPSSVSGWCLIILSHQIRVSTQGSYCSI